MGKPVVGYITLSLYNEKIAIIIYEDLNFSEDTLEDKHHYIHIQHTFTLFCYTCILVDSVF